MKNTIIITLNTDSKSIYTVIKTNHIPRKGRILI